MVPNTIQGVDAQLDEELLTVQPILICGKCNKQLEQISAIAFRCPGCGDTVNRA